MGNILITGFEPFGGMSDNPSGRIAQALDGRLIASRKVVARMLPVSLARLDVAIAGALADAGPKPSLVIGLGVLPGHGFLKLERRAANKTDFSFEGADNDGHKPQNGVVEAGGPQTRASTFDVDKALVALGAKRIPAKPSDSAGFFICNATLYKLLASPTPMPAASCTCPRRASDPRAASRFPSRRWSMPSRRSASRS